MDIEQIIKERDAAVSALSRLTSLAENPNTSRSLLIVEGGYARMAMEALKPKPEPFECWVNLYRDGSRNYHESEEMAQTKDGQLYPLTRRAVHLREVTPAPEWERWGGYGHTIYQGSVYVGNACDITLANEIADAHNAEMQRVTGTEGK